MQRITSTWHPREIWLFGSRARGTAAVDSDWDLLVVVPDRLAWMGFDHPMEIWKVTHETGVRACLRIAKEDLEGARMLNARHDRNAIYLCEQAAEKLIRAVLTYQLDEMVASIPDLNPMKPRLVALQHLSKPAANSSPIR